MQRLPAQGEPLIEAQGGEAGEGAKDERAEGGARRGRHPAPHARPAASAAQAQYVAASTTKPSRSLIVPTMSAWPRLRAIAAGRTAR